MNSLRKCEEKFVDRWLRATGWRLANLHPARRIVISTTLLTHTHKSAFSFACFCENSASKRQFDGCFQSVMRNWCAKGVVSILHGCILHLPLSYLRCRLRPAKDFFVILALSLSFHFTPTWDKPHPNSCNPFLNNRPLSFWKTDV